MKKVRYTVPVLSHQFSEGDLSDKLERRYLRLSREDGVDIASSDIEIRVHNSETARNDNSVIVVFESHTDEDLSAELIVETINSVVPNVCDEPSSTELGENDDDVPHRYREVDEDGWEHIPDDNH